jgi:hypothetical protein
MGGKNSTFSDPIIPLFWNLGFHGNVILNFINTPKASTHYSEYSYDVS